MPASVKAAASTILEDHGSNSEKWNTTTTCYSPRHERVARILSSNTMIDSSCIRARGARASRDWGASLLHCCPASTASFKLTCVISPASLKMFMAAGGCGHSGPVRQRRWPAEGAAATSVEVSLRRRPAGSPLKSLTSQLAVYSAPHHCHGRWSVP